jgi:hypothetical protein
MSFGWPWLEEDSFPLFNQLQAVNGVDRLVHVCGTHLGMPINMDKPEVLEMLINTDGGNSTNGNLRERKIDKLKK